MTYAPNSKFLKTVTERGFFHQCTDLSGLDTLLVEKEQKNEQLAAYIGFDCTAKSLHAGSLMQIMMLYWLQQTGHKPIVLMGGGTTKIGDPSGKDEARKLLTDDDIAVNMAGIKRTFNPFLKFGDGKSDAVMVNNDDWLKGINYVEFLRDYGKHFSVNRMMSMDSVKLRLEREQNLSFLEFNYMILQAYDFVELNKRLNCRLQIGGSDQWGNIINGVELHRRKTAPFESEMKGLHGEIFGLTTPLLTTSSGAKMGKTASGAVWLDREMLSPYDYWQYWRNTEDADVGKFLRLFTTLPLEHIKELESATGAAINEAKKILATEVTKLCHGEEEALKAADTARKTFEQGGVGDDLPEFKISKAELDEGIPAYKLFHMAGLTASGGEARKLIQGKGAKVNDTVVENENVAISSANLTAEGYIKLSAGKKRHALVKII